MFFQQSLELVAMYISRQNRSGTGFDIEVGKEMLGRLRSLEWLYARVVELEGQLIADYESIHGTLQPNTNVVLVYLAHIPEVAEPFTPQEELRILAEAFYHCAYRLLVILKQCGDVLPGLRSVEAIGIRRVRNNLIEHANKKGGRASYTFSVSNAAGIRFRSAALAAEPDAYLDEGLRANASELRSSLGALFRSVQAA